MAIWTKEAKNVVSWLRNSFLLKEDAFYLLLETGYKIILDGPNNGKHYAVFTNETKN